MSEPTTKASATGIDWKTRIRAFLPKSKISLAQKIFFAENMRVMIRAGLSYEQAFRTLVLQATNKRWKAIIADIASRVERGETLAAAFASDETFPPIFISMIRVGEVSGTLEKSLEELVMQMKKDLKMKQRIRGAMMYPAIVLTATVAISIGMLVFVVPKIVDIFKEVKATLPLATRILIAVSNFTSQNGLVVAVGIVTIVVASVMIARTKQGRSTMHLGFLKAPIIGKVVMKVNLARATRTLATLLRTGIPVVDAFNVTADVLGNLHYQKAFVAIAAEVKLGTSIGDAFAKHPSLFPALVTQMIIVGEQAGKLDEMLTELAVFYEEEVDETLANLTQIIEPILILSLGAAVGGIALAIISPMYALSESF